MGREEEYVARARALQPRQLLDFWSRLMQSPTVEDWEPGRALEYFILRAFELEGARVVWPYTNELEQVDGALYVDGLSCIVECKHWSSLIDVTPIARLKLRLDRRPPGTLGLMFGVPGFTSKATEEVQLNPVRNVLLWEGSDITWALKRGLRIALNAKWRQAVENGLLLYDLEEEGSP